MLQSEKDENGKNKKSKAKALFVILTIVGACLFVVGLVLFCCTPLSNIGLSILEMILLPVGFMMFFIGLSPLISKGSIKLNKYILSANKDDLAEISKQGVDINKKVITDKQQDLRDIANVSAEIQEDAIKRTASAVREGWEDGASDGKKFCSNCGKLVNKNANFCSNCGSSLKE